MIYLFITKDALEKNIYIFIANSQIVLSLH